eukprot:CAMPEP_0206364700 /NCGR_PEP_ID=MMETSP0294-20121207/2380_1 /ASSEMBLY_ACC=CAM_ASM_000327 /TAXON_ID=39354 /ORGANISM="Heterosigma akashiwo, Strain CCMP2393" /LENGTH=83 /DNA_ID=CAMNT_0053810359 /DNA_START=590 /DNA_END=838 /DNA_ORIENTATION=-
MPTTPVDYINHTVHLVFTAKLALAFSFKVEVSHAFAHPLSTLEPLFMCNIDHAFQLVLPTEPGNQLITEIESSALVAPSYLAP